MPRQHSVSAAPLAAPSRRLEDLRRLRRQGVFGGGALLTLLLLVTAVISAVGTVNDFHARERQSFLEARSAIDYFLFQRDRAYAGSINANDTLWAEQRPLLEQAGAPLAERFLAQGQELVIRAEGRTAVPWLVLGLPGNPLKGAELQAYLGMLEAYSAYTAATLTSLDSSGPAVMYGYEPQGRLLAIANLRDEAQLLQTLGVATREQAFAVLLREEAAARRHVPAPGPLRSAFQAGRLTSRHGLNPINGQPSLIGVLTLADGNQAYFRRVLFESVDAIKARLAASERGRFVTATEQGSVVFSSGQVSATEATALARWGAGGVASVPVRHYQSGQFIVVGGLQSTDWALVHSYDWADIWQAKGPQLLLTLLTALAIILLLWALLLRMDRRVLAPALSDASRVYESDALSQAIIGTAPIGLALVAKDSGAPLVENHAAQRLVAALEPGAVPAAQVPALYAELAARARALHGADDLDFHWSGQGGEDVSPLQLQVGMAAATYRERQVWVCALRDVTDQVELEDNLRRAREDSEAAREAAEAANRAKSAFVATMSHEIRTPLNGVLGHLELLARSPLQASQRERLERIRYSADSLMDIISDVLDFSKIEAGQLDLEQSLFTLRPLLEGAAILFAPQAQRKRVRLYLALEFAPNQQVLADVLRIRQILNNLVSNAVKFTESGRILLRASLGIGAEGGDQLCLEVIDSGIGMSSQQLSQLFEPFQQADASVSRRYGGSGLGLALCRQLTTAMGGTIEVQSTLGVGSRFTVCLPVQAPPAPGLQAPLAASSVTLLSASPEWRSEFQRLLEQWGATVRSIEQPQQARADQATDVLLIVGEQQAWTEQEEAQARGLFTRVVHAHAGGPLQPEARPGGVVANVFTADAVLSALLLQAEVAAAAPRPEPSLPASVPAAPAEPLARAAAPRARVLLVEDNPVNRELLQQQLEELGLAVDAVEHGQAALSAFDPETHAAVLTDINMPVMDGYALARALRGQGHTLPIVAITATALASERERCLAAGIDELLLKPLNLERLEAALDALAHSGRLRPPAGTQAAPAQSAAPRRKPVAIEQVFVDSATDDARRIQHARQHRDSEALLERVHGLKGALLMMGEQSLGTRFSSLERQLRDGMAPDVQELDALMVDLHACIERYRSQLQAPLP